MWRPARADMDAAGDSYCAEMRLREKRSEVDELKARDHLFAHAFNSTEHQHFSLHPHHPAHRHFLLFKQTLSTQRTMFDSPGNHSRNIFRGGDQENAAPGRNLFAADIKAKQAGLASIGLASGSANAKHASGSIGRGKSSDSLPSGLGGQERIVRDWQGSDSSRSESILSVSRCNPFSRQGVRARKLTSTCHDRIGSWRKEA